MHYPVFFCLLFFIQLQAIYFINSSTSLCVDATALILFVVATSNFSGWGYNYVLAVRLVVSTWLSISTVLLDLFTFVLASYELAVP